MERAELGQQRVRCAIIESLPEKSHRVEYFRYNAECFTQKPPFPIPFRKVKYLWSNKQDKATQHTHMYMYMLIILVLAMVL